MIHWGLPDSAITVIDLGISVCPSGSYLEPISSPLDLYITEADRRILLKHTFGQTSSTIDPLQLKERLLRGGWEAMAEQPWRTRKRAPGEELRRKGSEVAARPECDSQNLL